MAPSSPSAKLAETPVCGACGGPLRPVLDGLYDTRFGAPGTYAVWQCRVCDLVQTWPRPAEPELAALYERYYNAGITPGGRYQNWRERFLNSALYRLWLRIDGDIAFQTRRGTGRLLEVGANEGRNLAFYAAGGFQAEGLEINPVAAAAARQRGLPVHTTRLEDFSPGYAFQVVVLANVLEHALDPAAMLQQVRRLLSPTGEVWISCPNAASFWRRVFGKAWINWHVPYHLWHFSPATLTNLLRQSGFKVFEPKTFTPALWIAQSVLAPVNPQAGKVSCLLRSAPATAGLMALARLLLLPLGGFLDRKLAGDCLTVTATRSRP